MSDSVRDPVAPCPLLSSETRPRMVKAVLLKAANNDTGRAIERARQLRGWSLKEFAGAAQRGERQIARWMDGTEHPQLDTLFAIVSFRQPLIVALAEIAGLGVNVRTTITMRRIA